MTTQNETCQRVARFLDGEPIELSAEERELARQVRDGESLLAGLDIPAPAAACDRARRRLIAATRTRRWLRVGGSFAAAAAAGLVLFVSLQLLWQGGSQPSREQVAPVPTSVLITAFESDSDETVLFDIEAGVLEQQLRQTEAEVATASDISVSPAVDGGLDDLQDQIETFWQDESEFQSLLEG